MTPERPAEILPEDGASAAFPAGTPLPPEPLPGASAETAFAVWQVLRSVSLWTAEPPERREGMFGHAHVDEWERRLLTSPLEPEARFPLAVIVAELGAGAGAAGRLSWACVCVADWALGRGARRVALAFAEAAARADPEHPRYAWLVGRLMRSHGDPRGAERWLRRALRLATDQRDWETQSRALTALGNLCVETGRYPDAREWHTRALRVSRRWRLREQEGMALHDLFVIATEEGDRDEAERHARDALAAYADTSPARVTKLAHDVAYGWMQQGYFARALQVFLAIRPSFPRADDELRVVANLARAAAGSGDAAAFAQLRADAEALRPRLGTGESLAPALLELARGAAALGEWAEARVMAEDAVAVARARSEGNVRLRAEALAAAIAVRDTAGVGLVTPRRGGSGEDLAVDLVAAMERPELPDTNVRANVVPTSRRNAAPLGAGGTAGGAALLA